MRVLGIDPGLSITGYAVIEMNGGPTLLEAGVIRGKSRLPLPERIMLIKRDLDEVFKEFSPQVMGLESLYSEYKHPRAALQMAHVRGVVCLLGAEAGIPVMDLAPTAVKQALTGTGSATKAQMQLTVQRIYSLAEPPSPPDVADAIAIATAAAYRFTGRAGARG